MNTGSAAKGVSLARLYALRAMYGLIALAMGAMIWPRILGHTGDWSLMGGVEKCMLGALTLLSLLGLRYPLRMLPLLFWEAAWKTIWLASVALPAGIAGRLDGDTAEIAAQCAIVVLVYAAIPWGYVARSYALDRGDRWSPAPKAALA